MKKTWFFCLLAVSLSAAADSDKPVVPIQTVLQIPYALESITGVPSRDQEISNYFGDHRAGFPRQGLVEEVSEIYLFSQISYSSLYCKKMIDRDVLLVPEKRWAHRNLDFTVPLSSWSEETKRSQLREYSRMFWLRDLNPDEENSLLELFNVVQKDVPGNAMGTSRALMALCAVFGTSFSFLSL